MSNGTLIAVALTACVVATLSAMFLVRAPRLSFAIWILAAFLLPIWVGVSVGFFMSAVTVLTLGMVVLHSGRFRLAGPDAFMLVFAGLIVILFGMRQVEVAYLVSGFLELVIPYFWGRIVFQLLPERTVSAWIAGAAVGVGVLAIIEFATGSNMFIAIPGSEPLRASWATLQPRAGFLRAEAAFGHSIALGAVLAMSAAFLLAAPARAWLKVSGLVIVGSAVVVTFSRIGLITFVLTVVISLFALRSLGTSARWLIAGVLAAAAFVVIPFLDTVFLDAGGEAGGSADYRGDLTVLLSQVHLIGGASGWEERVVGDIYLGDFTESTDNAFISLLLRYGYLPTAALFAVYAAAVVGAIRYRRISPAAVAIIAQVPGLFAVAFITQYGLLLWFVVGLAVAGARPTPPDPSPATSVYTENSMSNWRRRDVTTTRS